MMMINDMSIDRAYNVSRGESIFCAISIGRLMSCCVKWQTIANSFLKQNILSVLYL